MKRSDILAQDWRNLCAISKKLRQWGEDECNGKIQCDDDGNYRLFLADKYGSFTIPDAVVINTRQGNLEKAARIASKYGAMVYHQQDPRGCALYLYRPQDLRPGQKIDECYSLCALACC